MKWIAWMSKYPMLGQREIGIANSRSQVYVYPVVLPITGCSVLESV